MTKQQAGEKLVSIEIAQEGDERFILRTFADGQVVRHPKVEAKEALSRSTILALGFK